MDLSPHIIILGIVNIVLIGFYMRARLRKNLRQVAWIQPLTVIITWLMVLISLLLKQIDSTLAVVVLIGMGLAIVGDFVNLDMSDPKVVMRGLVIATIAYLTFGIGFLILSGFQRGDIFTGIPLLIFYALTMILLWQGLGAMRYPALIYGLVLPFLFWRGLSTLFSSHFTLLQGILLSLGTLFLYMADFEFAFDAYRKPRRIMFGPILYAGGEFLIGLGVVLN